MDDDVPMLPDATKPETAVAPTFQPPLPLSPAAQWKIPLGMEWHDKAGRAKSPVWDYFRIEVPLGTEQHPVSEIVCVHASHAGERVVVKAPSNTSNLRKHLSNMHGIFLEGVRGASQAVPVADALPPPADATLSPAADAAPAARKRPHTQRAKHPRTVSMRPADTPPCGVDATHGQRPPLARTGQVHEDDSAAVVVVCEPALSKTMGALHPAGALYARPVHISEARAAHAAFVALLRRRGVETHDVRDLLARDADWNVGDRCRLEDLAAKALTYKMAADASAATADPHAHEQHRHYVSDEYKRSVLKEMDVSQLVDIVMTTPTVTITDTGRDTGYLAQYTFSPSTNIMFCRDQQVTTAAGGVVMARLQSKQRAKEGDILEFCLRKLGANVLGRVERGFLEGGDFFPCGLEMCFIGIGPRSTYPAVHWMMEMNVLGTQDVVVVRDELDMSQDRMHLDCVFNIVGKKVVVMVESIVGKQADDKSRYVDVWRKCPSTQSSMGAGSVNENGNSTKHGVHGQYQLVEKESNVEFSAFLTSRGFTIIPVTAEEQLEYGCNVLNLGNGRLVSTETESARRIAMHPAFTGTVEYLNFSAVTAMYGGVHCASQVVQRRPQ